MSTVFEMIKRVRAVVGRDKERRTQWVLVLLLSDGSIE